MHSIASRPIALEPLLAEEHAGRPTEQLGLDTVLADLHRLGAVRLEVGAQRDEATGAVVATYTCVLRPRTQIGQVRATARTAIDAALGCQLAALRELRDAAEEVAAAFLSGRDPA